MLVAAGGHVLRPAAVAEESARSNRQETAAIRPWVRESADPAIERGRIPKSVIEAYQAAS